MSDEAGDGNNMGMNMDIDNTIFEEDEAVPVDNKKYVKVRISFSTLTENTALIMRGNLVCSTVRYLNNNIEHFEAVKGFNSNILKSEDESFTIEPESNSSIIITKYIELITGIKVIDKIPKFKENFPEIKDKIKKLHDDNLGFMTEIDDKVSETNHIEFKLVQQSKAIWNQIVNRYRATLSKGSQFVNFGAIKPSLLCTGISATVSCDISGPSITRQISCTDGLCKVCYTNPIDTILECKHVVVCTECVKTDMDINKLSGYNCPLCRNYGSFVKLNEQHAPYCTKCDKEQQLVSYYGECRHPISCRNCAKNQTDKDILHCDICDTDVKVIKVFL